MVVILVIALIIFGPRKLPEMGKALGKGLMEFRNATKKLTSEFKEEDSGPEEVHPGSRTSVSAEKETVSQI